MLFLSPSLPSSLKSIKKKKILYLGLKNNNEIKKITEFLSKEKTKVKVTNSQNYRIHVKNRE